eukprot:CAMPEP_0206232488 /NCGR_PEP_ID=MMETSP0047_2-20121206/11442_1 /ASSEMBLY_ACC=CAM_ASM_000192 /TAXON_ID=195065 /ORGANISM="Chroomonas mesostigmatica_cf, Strain CCMP1168" /LENGTH=227 /DNA_ID=CAMNT_0053656227 /DNA_START=137 /DNA_END=816 /DNA_ORIENTATION=+
MSYGGGYYGQPTTIVQPPALAPVQQSFQTRPVQHSLQLPQSLPQSSRAAVAGESFGSPERTGDPQTFVNRGLGRGPFMQDLVEQSWLTGGGKKKQKTAPPPRPAPQQQYQQQYTSAWGGSPQPVVRNTVAPVVSVQRPAYSVQSPMYSTVQPVGGFPVGFGGSQGTVMTQPTYVQQSFVQQPTTTVVQSPSFVQQSFVQEPSFVQSSYVSQPSYSYGQFDQQTYGQP